MTSRAGCEASPLGGAPLLGTPKGIPDDVRGTPARAPRRPPHGVPVRCPCAPPPASVAVCHVLPSPLVPRVVARPGGSGTGVARLPLPDGGSAAALGYPMGWREVRRGAEAGRGGEKRGPARGGPLSARCLATAGEEVAAGP